jgi:hypothetical protein
MPSWLDRLLPDFSFKSGSETEPEPAKAWAYSENGSLAAHFEFMIGGDAQGSVVADPWHEGE